MITVTKKKEQTITLNDLVMSNTYIITCFTVNLSSRNCTIVGKDPTEKS